MNKPAIFINVGWMREYRGLDEISGGGKFVEEHQFGHEALNFLPYQGHCYGIRPAAKGDIHLERLGAAKGAPYLDDVLVVWVARSLVVGWYKHARLYRKVQDPPQGSNRMIQGEEFRYHAVAKESDCRVLPPEARSFAVPRAHAGKAKVEGGMGRYVWYAEGHEEYRKRLDELIASENSVKKSSKDVHHAWHADPLQRTKVEQAASAKIEQYYGEQLGYSVTDVSKENYGWDLEAKKNDVELYLEVKGLSGGAVRVELTPNEYKQMKKHRERYRVCIVTDALSESPTFAIYAYNPDTGRWEHHDNGTPINVDEVIGARLYV